MLVAQSFLTLKGSGYRAERKGSPLANIYRQWCDASCIPCILIEQGLGSNPDDTVLVDFSPLRRPEVSQVRSRTSSLSCLSDGRPTAADTASCSSTPAALRQQQLWGLLKSMMYGSTCHSQ